jgi:hypothetical protein
MAYKQSLCRGAAIDVPSVAVMLPRMALVSVELL